MKERLGFFFLDNLYILCTAWKNICFSYYAVLHLKNYSTVWEILSWFHLAPLLPHPIKCFRNSLLTQPSVMKCLCLRNCLFLLPRCAAPLELSYWIEYFFLDSTWLKDISLSLNVLEIVCWLNLYQCFCLRKRLFLYQCVLHHWNCLALCQKFDMNPLDTGRNLNLHKMFRRRPRLLLIVLCTFSFRSVSRG